MKCNMSSTFIPVETILKVDDNAELLIGENEKAKEHIPESTVNGVSIGTQCDWKVEPPDEKICNLLSISDTNEEKYDMMSPNNIPIGDRSDELPLVIRNWPQCDTNISTEPKFIIPATFTQQFASNFQTLPFDEKFFLQFDYKTRNKLKTKQRRLDPLYRSQERVRQRTVMRIKRQDPRFRAAEREKGRYRMRLKRLDPVFRSQERERQRERMKQKRSDPDFREKEREQQKNRLHVKRLDPAFKERERAQDHLRMQMKRQSLDIRQNLNIYNTPETEQIKIDSKSDTSNIINEHALFKDVDGNPDIAELKNNHVVCPEGFSAKLLQLKPCEPHLDAFHFKKQHILNFNFYNSGKEQFITPDEVNGKLISPFTIVGDNLKLQTINGVDNNVNVVNKNRFLHFKKAFSKHDFVSQNLSNIKPEESIVGIGKEKHSLHTDSSVIPSYSLASVSGH